MATAAPADALLPLLRERIRSRGAMTFAEYMEACLYHPEFGYYSRHANRGMRDYYTSADVHPIFGRLLMRQFAEMWRALGCPEPFFLAEAGAGTGALAKHVLDAAAETEKPFYAALRYTAAELSAPRRTEQEKLLKEHVASGRAEISSAMPAEIPAGCIFSNELLDAFPVHRVAGEPGGLREIYVDLDAQGETLYERTAPLSTPRIEAYFAEQGIRIREGQQAEAGLAACDWIEDAGRRLGRGFLVTIDYGHDAKELYDERHMRGTLLAYLRHRSSEDYYRAPGEQDLTAHVNFTALILAGRRQGLEPAGLVSQSRFLLALARASEFADLARGDPADPLAIRKMLLFKNLIHPEGMGEIFRVLIQQKNAPGARLSGLEPI